MENPVKNANGISSKERVKKAIETELSVLEGNLLQLRAKAVIMNAEIAIHICKDADIVEFEKAVQATFSLAGLLSTMCTTQILIEDKKQMLKDLFN